MKTIRETLACLMPARRARAVRWLKPALVAAFGLAAGMAGAQPANDNFAGATVLQGGFGTTNGDNTLATLEPCETNAVNTTLYPNDPQTNSVWFAWTCQTNGIMELDTAGSAFETILAVWTSTNNAPTLCDGSLTNIAADDNGMGTYSQVSIPVAAGVTYYISVASWNDGSAPFDNAGAFVLNWNGSFPTLPSGGFKLSSTSYTVSETDSSAPIGQDGGTVNPSVRGARITITRPPPAYGRVLVDYQVEALTYTNHTTTITYGTNIYLASFTTNGSIETNYNFSTTVVSNNYEYYAGGYQYYASSNTITATTNLTLSISSNGVSLVSINFGGRLDPAPTNPPPPNLGTNTITIDNNLYIASTNTDNATYTNIVYQNIYELPSTIVSNIVTSASGFALSGGTLTFDSFQMSTNIVVPVNQTVGPDFPAVSGIPSLALVVLSNPRLDPLEDTNSLIAPGLNPASSSALINALSTTFVTYPGIFNFERSTFRVNRNQGTATVSVYRYGGNGQDSVTVDYTIDPTPPLNGGYNPPSTFHGGYSPANTFPRQAGSDYATPDTQANGDFTPVSGTLSWGVGDYSPKQITIPILNNGLVEFNQDLLIQLYNPLPVPTPSDPGMMLGFVNSATLTILFDNTFALGGQFPGQQPAGSVDRTWNKDGANDSIPPYLNYPGTTPGNGGTVYAVAEQPDGRAIIAGSFVSFDSTPYNRIVRTLPNGYQDPTFLASPNSGANDFIAALALQPDGGIIIGGNFTAFNGYNRHYIARLNSDGSVDTTFNPGLGANGTVWSVALDPSGKILIGGTFTAYNGMAVNQLARLNPDGSLDTNFVSGVLGTGTNVVVDAVAVDSAGRVLIGGNFDTVAGVNCGAVARLNADGSLDTTFTPGIGTFSPETFTTDPVHAIAVQADGKILIGGSFSYFNLVSENGLARLNPDGTLDLTFHSGTGTLNPITRVADTVYAMLIQPDGNILIGGDFTTYNQTRRVGLARVLPDGSLDTSFMDTGYNELAGVPNRYFNPDAVAPDYPYDNTRNAIYALALESNPFTTASNILIGGSFTRVGGGTTRDDIHPRSNVARVIGGMTPGPGNIEFSYSDYSVNNSDGSLYVSLVRTNGNLGIISATFTTNTAAPGPGIASGADFSLSPVYAHPTWDTAWYNGAWMYDYGDYGPNYNLSPPPPRGGGATTGNPNVYINIFNPGNISGNLSANFALSWPVGNFSLGGQYIPLGAALGAQNAAPLTIIDSNVKAGVLGFSSPVYSVIENGSSAVITLTRTNGSDNAVTVWYATSDGTATNGVDYTGATNQVTFGIGQISATFSVPTRGHYTSIQPDKTVNLRLFTPSGGATLGLANATLTLINPNYAPGHVSFSAVDYPVNENAGTAVITVNRLGGSATTLGVTFFTADGSAFNGTNYSGVTTNLFWNSGDATSRTISVPVMDDGVVTSNLTAYLQLTNSQVNGTNNSTPLAFGGTNATLTINNVDSAGTFQFSSATYSVKKYGGYALVPVTRTGGSIGTVTINYFTMDGTASNGIDYIGSTNTLTFTNGEVSQVLTVPVLPGGSTNGFTDLFIQLSTNGLTTLASLGSPTNATLYIINSDSVNEPPGTGDPTYSPFAGFNNNVYTLVLQTNNQLLVGGDFTMADGVPRNRIARLNADGSLDADFSLPSSSMGADGSVRTIAVQTDGRILIGGLFTNFNSVARSRIARINPDGTLDNLFNPGSGADNPVYAVAQTFVNGVPKVLVGGAFASISGTTFNGIGRLNSDGTPDTTFNVGGLGANDTVYALAVQPDGKIVIGGDFTAVNGDTNLVHFARLNADGSVDTNFLFSGASDSVRAIALQLDGRILIGGLFTNVDGVAMNHLARLNADGTLDASFTPGAGADDAVFALGIQSDNRIVVGGEFTTCSGVTRNRITRLNPDGTLDPSINFGTGANDFVAAIAVQEDSIAGYPAAVPDEKIIIGGGFTQYDSQPHAHIARIFGGSIGGSGAFQFSSANYQVDERGTNVVITVLRTGGTTNAPTGDIFVTANVSDGSAVAGVNYTNLSPYLLDFPLGEVLKTFVIPVRDDGMVTPNLTVNLAITNPTAPAEIGNQPTAVLTILNDDSTVSFASSTYSVPKNIVSGTAAINLVRQGSTNGTTTVSFTTTAGGTAVPVTDYTPVSQLVTFNPGASVATVNIPINNNGIVEGNRTVTMQIANAGGATLISPTNATLTIIDTVNAPGQLFFATNSYTITEGGGVGSTNVYITVQRAFGSSGTVSVNFQTVDGSAQAGLKYVATNGVLTFGDGESSKTFFVPVLNTLTAEGPETFAVILTNATGGASIADPSNTVVTILNTNTGIAFASGTSSFTEPDGEVPSTLMLNVMRYNNTNGTTTVNYSTTNGTATDGVNFVGINNGILTFGPGDSVKTIAISTLHDPRVTGDLTFTIGLANPSSGAQLTSPSYVVVTDHDADAGISFLTDATSVSRNAGYVLIPVICYNTNVEPVSVQYATGGGSAIAGSDYTATSGTLSFTNGIAVNYFYVPILLNNSVQTNRTFDVTLSSPTPPGVLVPPSVETVTIIGTNTPAGLSFSTPIVITGPWGTTNVDNSRGAAETGDPLIAGFAPEAPVWFQWTAPAGMNGEVALDTIGSADTNGLKLDTVLGVYTGSSLSALNQVAANDDLYPLATPGLTELQYNQIGQNIFNTNPVVFINGYNFVYTNASYVLVPTYGTNNNGEFRSLSTSFSQPFNGPSGLRFNAQGGTTYYIAADTKSGFGYTISNGVIVPLVNGRGSIHLSWAYHPSGVFRFATENVDQTGISDTNGNPMLLYQCAETEGGGLGLGGIGLGTSDHRTMGPYNANYEYNTTYHAYYYYDVQGLLVTVTRVAGSSGRMLVDYTTEDGDTNIIHNGDVPAVAGQDYTPVSGTLVFDDYEMSKTIVVPIVDDGGLPRPNRDFMVVLSNPRRDPAESGAVSVPRVDPVFGKVLCRILDCDIDPKGPSSYDQVVTNFAGGVTNVVTNTITADQFGNLLEPTNAIFNFSKAHYRVPRDVQDYWSNNTPVTVYVNRMGTNTSSVTLHYRFDNYFLTKNGPDDPNNEFPLEAGSDYAVPTPPNASGIFGTNSDFDGIGGDSGTLTFPGGKNNPFQSQPIHFNVHNNHLTGFNKDIHIGLYEEDKDGNPQQDGMVAECNVTILFDDTVPPAGSVDELYNPDFATDLALLTNNLDLNTSVPNPGTDPLGEVYAVALTTNNQAVIGGAFATYTDSTNTYTVNGLARLNPNGSLDPTFNTGSGVNVFPAGEFIRSLALSGNQVVIGGAFTSYNGIQRNNIARVNADGSLDTTFTPGAGANGEVWSVLVQANGKVLIGGEFTKYNGQTANYVARLNTDGSLDTTFNASNIITGPVYAMSLAGDPPFSFTHSSDGTTNEDDQVLNLGLRTSGVLNVFYDITTDPYDMQVYYGDTNVTAGTGVLLFDTGAVGAVGGFSVPFGPVNGFTTNIITIVMNAASATNATPIQWTYTASIPGVNGLMVGGHFNVAGQSYANVARLNLDGSLNTSFNPGTGPDGSVLSLAWQPDNKVVLGGAFHSVSGVTFNNLARLNADGSIDAGFQNGTGADGQVNSITLQAVPAEIYVGGPFTLMNGTHRLGFARLYSDGTVDTTFMDTAYNQFAGLPRILFADSPGTVNASALQSDGNVIIGGSFQEVGGGQADLYARAYVEVEHNLAPSTTDPNLLVSGGGIALEPKTRDGVRNHSNIARLIGGATPGPGNIGMVSQTYAVNKTQPNVPVTLVRANGALGYASANFTVLPGLAKSGVDYSYSSSAPTYPISWEYEGPTRMHSDGQFGANGLMLDRYGQIIKYGLRGPAEVNVNLNNNTASSGNLSAQFQMANPVDADQFYLGGQNIPLGVALGISQSPLTIIDNAHDDGVFSFAAPSYVATNSPFPVAIARTNGTFGVVQLSYQTVTNGSTAVPNVDYRPTNGVVTFNNGDVSQAFPVTILNNSYVSTQEKFVNLQLYNLQDQSGGNAQLGLTNAVMRIINPNYAGYLNFSTNAYYGRVSDGKINFTVKRTVGAKGTLTVQYATHNGTAVSGADYAGATNTLTWNSGDVSARTVSIPLVNNSVIGPNKQFTANLFNAALNGTNMPSLLGSLTNAVFAIINDNNYGTFQFSSAGYQFNENGGYATINVTRGGSALGTASVSFATVNGTAFAGTNYVATNSTLTFLPGEVVKSFSVKLLDDGKTNPPPAAFYFSVALSSPSAGSSLGTPTNSLVHIVDAESFNQQPGAVDASFTAAVNGSVLGLALQSGGQVVAGGTFTVADGTSMNRLARFNTDGTLDAGFLNGLAGADGSVNAVVSQTDDRVVIGGAFVKVDGQNRQRLARLMTDGTVDTSFNPGAGADNTVFALAEAFVNGARAIYVGGAFNTFNTVSSPGIVRLDNTGAVDPSFAVSSGANGTVYALAVYPTNSVYNAGKVLVGGLFTNFDGSVAGNLARLNPDGSVDTNFTLNVAIGSAVRAIAIQLDGSVLIGGDFTNVNATVANHIARLNPDGTLDTAFSAAAAPGINGTVNAISVQADNRIVVVGQFTQANGVSRQGVTRLLPTGAVDPSINFGTGANGAVNAAVIQPADGNLVVGGDFTQFNGQPRDHIARIFGGSMTGSGAFQFTSASYQVDENGGFATITIERTGGTSGTNADGSGDVYVAFTTTNGTAVAGVNYSYTTNYVDFPAGEVSKTVYVPVTDDGVITSNLTVNLQLSNSTPGTGLGDQAGAVLTIINDDSVVEFLNASPTVPKNVVDGFAAIQVVRVGSTSGSCTVEFGTTTNGTAVIGTDYYPTNALITFNPGVATNSIQIPIINNNLPEGNRTVTMLLTNAFNSVLASPSNAVLTIIDTVQAPGNLFFTSTNFFANASDGLAYLTVARTNGTSGSVSVTYTTVPGTALPGLNYISTTNSVTFNDGDTNKTFTIPLVNNTVAQGAVSLTVALSNPTGGAGLIAPTNTTLTIYNTNAVIGFALATNTVPENAGLASIVVERLNNTNIVSTVHYATTNGTAVAGINYSNIFGTLTFGVGETFKSLSIPLINQSNVTDLAFGVGLSSPVNARLFAPSNTVVIEQAAAAGISFDTNAATVNKNAGSLLVTVICSNPRVEPVATGTNAPLEVTYSTVDGTARAGINYQPVTGTLVFTNGLGTNTFFVPIFNNQNVSGDTTFSVILTNVTAPGRITPYGTQDVVIAESNAGLSFSQSDYSVFKSAGQATITVIRTGYTNSAVSVDYSITNGTAIAGQNYYPTNGTLFFDYGVTSQSFNVPIIANTQVQPNLFALMQLSNPTNAQIVKPGAATLTIVENGGSYVIPAGAMVVTNYTSHLNDGIIGSNDTVKVLFAFRDSAGLDVTNLIANLLATNGVVAPGPVVQIYGPLKVAQHSASMPFTFTAHGTNMLTIAPTFRLYDNDKYIGPATFVFTVGSWTTNFANTNAIIINDNAAASPYPSIINISGLGNTLVKATVTLTNLSHQNIGDMDVLVVSPTTNTLIMAHAGGGTKATHVTLTFDDTVTNINNTLTNYYPKLPQNGSIVTGTNASTQFYPVKNFP